jgi:small subunit ribosomal protein S18
VGCAPHARERIFPAGSGYFFCRKILPGLAKGQSLAQVEEGSKKGPGKNVATLTWLDSQELARFVTETGKIQPRGDTGLSAKDQRRVTRLIKRARNMLTMK